MALNASRYAVKEALRGDTGWKTYFHRHVKATLRYKTRLERINDARLVKKVFLWNIRSSRWGKMCVKMVIKNGLETSWVFQQVEGKQAERGWSMIVRNRGFQTGYKEVEERNRQSSDICETE